MITPDYNLLAYEYAKGQYTPNAIYPSGEKEEDKLIDKYNFNGKELPVLILENDVINDKGYGLKKGFYNVVPDKYLDFLLIFQNGNLKAKAPIIKTKINESVNVDGKVKPKKMSPSKYNKKLEKERRKYYKGINPLEIEYNNVEIEYYAQRNTYIIKYTSNNLELYSLIKL